jgi:hypothetical protein
VAIRTEQSVVNQGYFIRAFCFAENVVSVAVRDNHRTREYLHDFAITRLPGALDIVTRVRANSAVPSDAAKAVAAWTHTRDQVWPRLLSGWTYFSDFHLLSRYRRDWEGGMRFQDDQLYAPSGPWRTSVDDVARSIVAERRIPYPSLHHPPLHPLAEQMMESMAGYHVFSYGRVHRDRPLVTLQYDDASDRPPRRLPDSLF